MGYVGGMNNATWDSGKASAVIVAAAYTAPEAPKLGKMGATLLTAVAWAAEVDEAATAAAHVSVFWTAEIGDASSATSLG